MKSKVVGKRCLKLLSKVHGLVVSVELKALQPQDIFVGNDEKHHNDQRLVD